MKAFFIRAFFALVLDPLTRHMTRKAAMQVAKFRSSTPFVQRNTAPALRHMNTELAAFEASRARLRAIAGLSAISPITTENRHERTGSCS